jgi:hypothetical protein
MPDDFDADRVAGMILRGEPLPAHWLPLVTDLDLAGSSIVDLSPLAGLDHLRSLDLRGTKVGDLSALAGLRRLEELYVGGTEVSRLGPLASLSNLRCLDLPDTQVSDLAPLAGLRKLEDLDLRKTRVVDLKPLASLANLTSLDLAGTQVSNLKPLAGLRQLEELDLRETQVADLAPLAGLVNLQWLDLEGTRVTKLKPLAGLGALGKVNIRGVPIKDLRPIAHVQTVIGADTAPTRAAPAPSPQPAPVAPTAAGMPRPPRDWSGLWRAAAWGCGILVAAGLAWVLLAVASEPGIGAPRRLKGLHVMLFLALLPSATAVAIPWLCAARWGRRGAWIGARALVGFFLVLYAAFAVLLVHAGGGRQSAGSVAFGLVAIWLGVVTFAVCSALSASGAWPNGRPMQPGAGPSPSGKS